MFKSLDQSQEMAEVKHLYGYLLVTAIASQCFAAFLNSDLYLWRFNSANSYNVSIGYGGALIVNATLLEIPEGVPDLVQYKCGDSCYGVYTIWGTEYRLKIVQEIYSSTQFCYNFIWQTQLTELHDCIDTTGAIWYSGIETHHQTWPLSSKSVRFRSPLTPEDYLSSTSTYIANGGVVDGYWLSSLGAAIYVTDGYPVFVSYNTESRNHICLTARWQEPYTMPENQHLTLDYRICTGPDIKSTHQFMMDTFLHHPTEMVDTQMLLQPVWSTWAYFGANINASVVTQFAEDIVDHGFTNNSQIEIDDRWESCYGDATFDESFGSPSELVTALKALGFRTTLWVHPFINYNCDSFLTAVNEGVFVTDPNDLPALTKWWDGEASGLIDFTRTESTDWWRNRLNELTNTYGIDGFKFDAGETTWLPLALNLNATTSLQPNIFNTRYIEAVSYFGSLTEVRSAYRVQNTSHFVRMLDRDTSWSARNGLRSLIPTALTFGLIGYPFVLPDMVGGNDIASVSKELYIRWLQVNVFLPSLQMSIPPWHFDDETVNITLQMLTLRQTHAQRILTAAEQAITDGTPIIRPLWWLDETDSNTFAIDSEFLLGDDLLVAPILYEGATNRSIYFPAGTWMDQLHSTVIIGPTTLDDYEVQLDELPHFILDQ